MRLHRLWKLNPRKSKFSSAAFTILIFSLFTSVPSGRALHGVSSTRRECTPCRTIRRTDTTLPPWLFDIDSSASLGLARCPSFLTSSGSFSDYLLRQSERPPNLGNSGYSNARSLLTRYHPFLPPDLRAPPSKTGRLTTIFFVTRLIRVHCSLRLTQYHTTVLDAHCYLCTSCGESRCGGKFVRIINRVALSSTRTFYTFHDISWCSCDSPARYDVGPSGCGCGCGSNYRKRMNLLRWSHNSDHVSVGKTGSTES